MYFLNIRIINNMCCRSIICIFGGGLAAGLTIGIMSLDVGMSFVIVQNTTYEISHKDNIYTVPQYIYYLLIPAKSVGLELLIESGDPKESSYARKLAPIRKKVHLFFRIVITFFT